MRLLFFFLLVIGLGLNAQSDSIELKEDKDSIRVIIPKKAALYSTILPGMGQVYVGKHWYIKVPVIYGGFVGMGMAINYNHSRFITYRNEYRNRINNPDFVSTGDLSVLSDSSVKSRRDEFRRYRDLNYMLSVAWYGFNILEATVSAHLSQFDVGDDLTLNIGPYQSFSFDRSINNGIQVKLTF
ncbi:DUF5683 domain-containing protein [Flavobacteriales bacterium]|nr:DUF5683 domain-containing protein [Flavobacteriales bacterium]